MVRNVEDWADFRFVYFHTTEANYLQVPPERVKDIADQIASEVDGNSLPETIGLVGIPYSQSNSFYLNCLLPHEFGHFIYSQAASFDVETEIDKSLDAFTTVQNIADEEVISYRRDTLRRWIEETFCDLVALWLIGPAFTFAYSELTGASLSLGRELSDSTELYEFNNSYPADAARFYVHLQALKRLGWWNKISETASAPILVLKHFEHWSNDLYINIVLDEGDSIPDTDFMNLYKSLVGWLIDYVDETVPSGPSAVSDFDKQFPIISSYLERAVVPSTIRVGDERVYPSASVLLNSGYSFKLTRLANLLNRIDKRHPDSVTDVSELSERVELWILKSLEDQRLLTGQNNGSSSHE